MTALRMPSGFVGHGNPMNALGGSLADAWKAWGASLPRPEGVLVISAHFEAAPPTLSSTTGAGLIYDFSGFPEAMYRLEYSPPPAPALAGAVERFLAPEFVTVRAEDRGLDHGAWVPLLHLFPAHDVPTVQLSIPWTDDPAAMLDLGARLSPLRAAGYLILGSGNIVHNLRRVDWSDTGSVVGWAGEFDGWVAEMLRTTPEALAAYREHPLARTAHPTQEHFVPLLVTLGAAGDGEPAFPVAGFELGSISARCVEFS
ncbi:MAG: dioxygenase [Acidimicrobiia bacterium]|nr:dioxygenase [Acidimicrobiia bacterium]